MLVHVDTYINCVKKGAQMFRLSERDKKLQRVWLTGHPLKTAAIICLADSYLKQDHAGCLRYLEAALEYGATEEEIDQLFYHRSAASSLLRYKYIHSDIWKEL